eukprot:jgi/Undpi1/6702/HiC_scaffold_20.g09181.m1
MVGVATDGTPAANAGRRTRGGEEGGGGTGVNTGWGFSRPDGEATKSCWTRGFLLSSSRRASGGAPSEEPVRKLSGGLSGGVEEAERSAPSWSSRVGAAKRVPSISIAPGVTPQAETGTDPTDDSVSGSVDGAAVASGAVSGRGVSGGGGPGVQDGGDREGGEDGDDGGSGTDSVVDERGPRPKLVSGASSEVDVDGSGDVAGASSAVRTIAEGSMVSVATDGTPAASDGRRTRGGEEGGGGAGVNTGWGFSRPNGEATKSCWTRGFLLSSSRRASGGAPSGEPVRKLSGGLSGGVEEAERSAPSWSSRVGAAKRVPGISIAPGVTLQAETGTDPTDDSVSGRYSRDNPELSGRADCKMPATRAVLGTRRTMPSPRGSAFGGGGADGHPNGGGVGGGLGGSGGAGSGGVAIVNASSVDGAAVASGAVSGRGVSGGGGQVCRTGEIGKAVLRTEGSTTRDRIVKHCSALGLYMPSTYDILFLWSDGSTPSLLAGGPTKILGGIEPGINPVFSDFDAVHYGPRQPGTPMSFDDFYPTLASWRVRQAVRTARTQEKNAFNTFERAKAEAIPLVNAYLAPSGDGDGPALNVPPRTFEETSAILRNVETCARMLTLSKLRVTTAERIAMAAVKRDQYGDDARLFGGDGEAGGAPYQSTRRYGNALFCLSGPGVRPVLRRRMRYVPPNDLELGEADWRPGEVGGGRGPRRGGDDREMGGAWG